MISPAPPLPGGPRARAPRPMAPAGLAARSAARRAPPPPGAARARLARHRGDRRLLADALRRDLLQPARSLTSPAPTLGRKRQACGHSTSPKKPAGLGDVPVGRDAGAALARCRGGAPWPGSTSVSGGSGSSRDFDAGHDRLQVAGGERLAGPAVEERVAADHGPADAQRDAPRGVTGCVDARRRGSSPTRTSAPSSRRPSTRSSAMLHLGRADVAPARRWPRAPRRTSPSGRGASAWRSPAARRPRRRSRRAAGPPRAACRRGASCPAATSRTM